MHANYFLFATLEQARPLAHGRVSADRSSPPVLTGTPVAGMVYLDRPSPAGYFIFPDLSVRHEGKYRLSFSLYEELKSAKDNDKSEDGSKPNAAAEPHVTHRLEVKSEPFHVFSAKKFPGLTESTSLSRMVAEQGCRVRIRRDVRMRRRDTKSGGKDWDDYEDETAQARARASATPDPTAYQAVQTPQGYMVNPIPRPRSASNASHQSTISRRPSQQDMAQAYGQAHYSASGPHTPQNGYSQGPSYGPSPTPQCQPSQFVQQQAHMQPPPPQYQPQAFPSGPQNPSQQAYYGYPAHPSQTQPQSQAQPQYSAPLQSSYEPAQHHQRSSVDYSSQASATEYRRVSQIAPPPPAPAIYGQQAAQAMYQPQQAYQQPSQQPYGQPAEYNNRPAPLEPSLPQARNGAQTPIATRPNFDLPPINTAIMPNHKLEASSPMSAAPPNSSYFSSTHTPVDHNKRSYGSVFSNRYQNEPLRQGARPSTSYTQGEVPVTGASVSAADDDDSANGELDTSTMGMHYRRADGRQILRALPSHA